MNTTSEMNGLIAAQIGERDPEPYEETLTAPFRFDVSIGYWTGEPDLELLAQALAKVPIDPDVERRIARDGVRLRGVEAAVREQARQLRAAGLT